MNSRSISSFPGTINDLEEDTFIQEPKPSINTGIGTRTLYIDTKDNIPTMNNFPDKLRADTRTLTKDLTTLNDVENKNRLIPGPSIIPSYVGVLVEHPAEKDSLDLDISGEKNHTDQTEWPEAKKLRFKNEKNDSRHIDGLILRKRSYSHENMIRTEENIDRPSHMMPIKETSNNWNEFSGKNYTSTEMSIGFCNFEIYKPLSFFSDYASYQKQKLHKGFSFTKRRFSTNEPLPPPLHNTQKSQKKKNGVPNCIRKMRKSISNTCQKIKKKSFKQGMKDLWERFKKPFLPDHKFQLAWDCFLMTLVLMDMVILPIQISFSVLNNLTILLLISDAFFVLDILVSFHTAYYYYGTLVTDHRKIAINYAKGWLIIDIIAAFPFYAIDGVGLASNDDDLSQQQPGHPLIRLFRLFKLLKILRALKFFKLNKIFLKIKAYFVSSPAITTLFQIMKLLIIILILAHWLGCAWHLVAVFEIQDAYETNWLQSKDLEDADVPKVYAYSLYWAVTTMLTVGYGDITPTTTAEVVFVIVAMLVGCAVFAYELSTINSIMQAWSQRREDMSFHIYAVNRFMKKNHFPQELQDRVLAYVDHLIEEEEMKRRYSETFFDLMPDGLKKEILMQIHGDALAKNMAFRSNFSLKLIKEVSNQMQEKSYYLDEIVYAEGTDDNSFYTVTKGRLGIFMHGEESPIKILQKRNCFGEISFFSGRNRLETIKSVSFSQTFYLEQKTFLEILEKHDDEKETYQEIRDKVNLYGNYTRLQVRCLACDIEYHPLQLCPRINYFPNPCHILKDKAINEKHFVKKFARRHRKRVNARIISTNLIATSDRIIEKYQDIHSMRNLLKSPDMKSLRSRYTHLGSKDQILEENYKSHREGSLDAEIMTHSKEESSNSFSEDFQARELNERFYSTTGINMAEAQVLKLLSTIKKKNKENISLDQVKTFKNYFKHNNVENVLQRLNGLNRLGFLNSSGKSSKGEEILYSTQIFNTKRQHYTLINLNQNGEVKSKEECIAERLYKHRKGKSFRRSDSM